MRKNFVSLFRINMHANLKKTNEKKRVRRQKNFCFVTMNYEQSQPKKGGRS